MPSEKESHNSSNGSDYEFRKDLFSERDSLDSGA